MLCLYGRFPAAPGPSSPSSYRTLPLCSPSQSTRANLVAGSWGKENGFDSDNRSRPPRTSTAETEASTAPFEPTAALPSSVSASLDILPFSEDEYEKIVVTPETVEERPMRCKSHEPMDDVGPRAAKEARAEADAGDAFSRRHQRALYAADLCYEATEPSAVLSRGPTLHQRSFRTAVVRRQSSAIPPGPAGATGPLGPPTDEPASSLFLSESELFSTELWSRDEASLGFGSAVSRSAEVLMCPPDSHTSLEASQVHAVLSVTPRKAYYRMTALDHELAGDATPSPAAARRDLTDLSLDFSAASPTPLELPEPPPAAPLLDAALQRLEAIGEEARAADSGVCVRPPVPVVSSSPLLLLPGQKRRYSRSACAPDSGISPVAPAWLPPERYEEEEEAAAEELQAEVRGGRPLLAPAAAGHVALERSASESSVIDAGARSSSWRELINQLEHDVRRHSGSGSGGLLLSAVPKSGPVAEDDAGSLADESASSGGDGTTFRGAGAGLAVPGGVGRSHGGRVRRVRRKATSMQLAEQAELIVQTRTRDSPASDADVDEPALPGLAGAAPEDGLDQAWDNYVHLYPSACEDDGEAEERLDLCWDEQLEASMDAQDARRRCPEADEAEDSDADAEATIEDLLLRSSRLLECARHSRALPPPAASPPEAPRSSPEQDDGPTELEREVARQSEWLAACETNLSCLDHLRESLTDSGVEDDLEPIRQQVEQLLKQWTAFKEETLGRLQLVEGLHKMHVEADALKCEAQRLADLLDAPTERLFMDGAQLDKFCSTLEFYEAHLPGWQISADNMVQTVRCSLAEEQVDYLDVRKCYAENLHLLGQWLFSLHTRTKTCLSSSRDLREGYEALLTSLHAADEALSGEEHLLRCTRLAVDIMNGEERETALQDLQAVDARFEAINAQLKMCEQQGALLAPSFILDHWQHIDSRLTTLNVRLVTLRSVCVTLRADITAARRQQTPQAVRTASAKPAQLPPPSALRSPSSSGSPKLRRRPGAKTASGVKLPPSSVNSVSAAGGPGASSEVARRAVNTWRGRRLWRYLRASLPYQLALLVLFGCVYYLLADSECDGGRRPNSLLFSPQVRQAFGSPY